MTEQEYLKLKSAVENLEDASDKSQLNNSFIVIQELLHQEKTKPLTEHEKRIVWEMAIKDIERRSNGKFNNLCQILTYTGVLSLQEALMRIDDYNNQNTL